MMMAIHFIPMLIFIVQVLFNGCFGTTVPPRMKKKPSEFGNKTHHHITRLGPHKQSTKSIDSNHLLKLFSSSSTTKLFNNLPTVLILPLKNTEGGDGDYFSRKDLFPGLDDNSINMNFIKHEQDVMFYLWLKNKYHKTINFTYRNADIFFVPTMVPQDTYALERETWVKIDGSITQMRKLMKITTSHGFMAGATHPNTLVALRSFYSQVRNIADLFVFRVDGENTLNYGRNIYVPYVINIDMQDFASYDEERKYLIMAACRETMFHKDNRIWRSRLYERWHNVAPKSNISLLLNHDEFDDVLANSEFCAILPGDTASTSKLYKALFLGCIPVIFVSYFGQLPFHKFLKWSDFAIIVYKDILYNFHKMDALLNHIIMVRQNQTLFHQYRHNVELARHLFDYYRYDWPSVYHLSLLEVLQRARHHERQMFLPN